MILAWPPLLLLGDNYSSADRPHLQQPLHRWTNTARDEVYGPRTYGRVTAPRIKVCVVVIIIVTLTKNMVIRRIVSTIHFLGKNGAACYNHFMLLVTFREE